MHFYRLNTEIPGQKSRKLGKIYSDSESGAVKMSRYVVVVVNA